MAAEPAGVVPIRTANPAPANIDAALGIVDSTGLNFLGVDASGRVTAKMTDGSGNSLSSTSGALQVDLAQQSLTAVKISATAAANAVGNPIFMQLSDGAAAFGEPANPFAIEVIVGGAIKGASGSPFFTELNQGAAALAAANGLPVRLTNGTAFNAQATPVFAAVSKDTAANALANPIIAQLSDGAAAVGTSGNPLFVAEVAGAPAGVVKHPMVLGGDITKLTSTNADFTVPTDKVWTIHKAWMSAADAGHFDMVIDPAGLNEAAGTFWVSAGHTMVEYDFAPYPITLTEGEILRFVRNNDSNQDMKMNVSLLLVEDDE